MKKNLVLITAIAAALAPMAAMSDASLYGSLKFSVSSWDEDKGTAASSDGIVANDNVSLFGLKASTEGDGLKAFLHLQTGASADAATFGTAAAAFSQRFYFGGLSGGFGQVVYGRMTNSYKFNAFKLDPFYNLSHVGVGGTLGAGGASYGLSSASNSFTNDAIQYTSPAFGGMKVNVGLYLDDSAADEHGTNIGINYSNGGISAGLQMLSEGDDGVATTTTDTIAGVIEGGDAMRLTAGYKADVWSVGLSFETVDLTATTDADYMYLVGKYNVSKETEVAASFGSVSDGAAEGSGMTFGLFQTVAPKTQLYALYSSASLDNATTGKDPSVFSVGAIHNF